MRWERGCWGAGRTSWHGGRAACTRRRGAPAGEDPAELERAPAAAEIKGRAPAQEFDLEAFFTQGGSTAGCSTTFGRKGRRRSP